MSQKGRAAAAGHRERAVGSSGIPSITEEQGVGEVGRFFCHARGIVALGAAAAATRGVCFTSVGGVRRLTGRAAGGQEAGLVPIVEPEILMDGDHDIEMTARIQEKVRRRRAGRAPPPRSACDALRSRRSPRSRTAPRWPAQLVH